MLFLLAACTEYGVEYDLPPRLPPSHPADLPPGWVADPWHPDPEPAPVDVLLVVDGSGSMRDDHARLVANAATFTGPVVAYGGDVRVAVAPMDCWPGGYGLGLDFFDWTAAWCAAPWWVDADDPDFAAVLPALVDEAGTGGPGQEYGTLALVHAIQRPTMWMRQAATLAVVVVSDEDDHTPAEAMPPGGVDAALQAEADLRSLLPDEPGRAPARGRVTVASSTPLDPYESCGSRAEAYEALAARWGGESSDLCSEDWAPVLEASLPRPDVWVRLSRRPVASTLSVVLEYGDDEVVLGGGWSYDTVANAVDVFDDRVGWPTGARVEYQVAGTGG